jgi:hypothetical protein
MARPIPTADQPGREIRWKVHPTTARRRMVPIFTGWASSPKLSADLDFETSPRLRVAIWTFGAEQKRFTVEQADMGSHL